MEGLDLICILQTPIIKEAMIYYNTYFIFKNKPNTEYQSINYGN